MSTLIKSIAEDADLEWLADLKIGANTSIDRAVRDLEPFAEWNEVSVTARQSKLGRMAREIWNVPNPEKK